MAYRDVILADSPVAYWPLDDWKYGVQPTRALDAGPNAIHSVDWANITKVGGPIAGQPAGWFNGSTSGMTIPGNALLDGQAFTIEAWIRPQAQTDGYTTASQNGFIFEKTTNGSVNTQYSLFMEGNEEVLRAMVPGSDYRLVLSSYLVHDFAPRGDRWRHIAGTRAADGTHYHYRDGVQVSSAFARPGTVPTGGGAAGTSFIGCYGTGGYRFKGGIAHVAVYMSVLSAARIAAHVAAAGQDSVSY